MATEREMVGTRVPDGVQMGLAATDKIAFFGAAPVVQQTAAAAMGVSYKITQADSTFATGSGAYGLDSSASMKLLCDNVVAMRLALVNAGLIA